MPSSPAPLREHIAGDLAARFGNLPKVALPADDEPLLAFAANMAEVLKDKGLYRRDAIVVIPYEAGRRLEQMTHNAFRSWAWRHVWTFKIRFGRDGSSFDVGKDMNKDVAIGVLESWDFWPALPEIRGILPVPMPRVGPDGTLALTQPGYDPAARTYTFPMPE